MVEIDFHDSEFLELLSSNLNEEITSATVNEGLLYINNYDGGIPINMTISDYENCMFISITIDGIVYRKDKNGWTTNEIL